MPSIKVTCSIGSMDFLTGQVLLVTTTWKKGLLTHPSNLSARTKSLSAMEVLPGVVGRTALPEGVKKGRRVNRPLGRRRIMQVRR